MAQKNFQDLDLKDAFLFAVALSDEETCRLILEMILGRSIERVKVHAEHALLFSSDFRSVRLDIYADDEMQVERDFALGDGTCKIFLNTKGINCQEVPEELTNFLHYVENTNDTYVQQLQDDHIGRLHDRISRLKKSREWEARYMTFEELLKKSESKGKTEGMAVGQERLLKLISCMSADGETERILELEKDKELLEKMYKRYNL